MKTNIIFDKIYLERKKLNPNYTQQQFASDCECDKHSVSDWKLFRNEMKFSKLEQLLKPLGLKPVIKIEKI